MAVITPVDEKGKKSKGRGDKRQDSALVVTEEEESGSSVADDATEYTDCLLYTSPSPRDRG